MRAQLLHLSGPLRGRTVTYRDPVVRVGSAPGSDAQLASGRVEPHHARIEWVERDCRFYLHRGDGQVFVNGNEVEEVVLHDGDHLEFGAGGPMARFRVYVPNGAVCKPVRRMLADAAEVARHSGGGTATRMLTEDLLTQATPQLKVGFPLLVVGAAFLVGWLGGWLGSRPTAAERRATADRVTRTEIEEMRARMEEMRAGYEAEIRKLRAPSENLRRIQTRWSQGVCLLHGVYRVRMKDGAWFELRPGDPFEIEYTGSGFLATTDGHVITNRHVALPWTEEEAIGPLIEAGAKPEFVHFTATFPGKKPIDIAQDSIRRRMDALDVAVVKLDGAAVRGVPVLALREDGTEGNDQQAIVIGYPTGLAALLARASSQTLEQLRASAATMTDAIAQLADAGQIEPVITLGIVSNVEDHLIAYDAGTTSGGSGGPVFSGKGDVIAVNFAIQRNFAGNNLGVPIRFARELLPK